MLRLGVWIPTCEPKRGIKWVQFFGRKWFWNIVKPMAFLAP